ncbi:hypothetical protein D3C86_746280 [compost metagenome]
MYSLQKLSGLAIEGMQLKCSFSLFIRDYVVKCFKFIKILIKFIIKKLQKKQEALLFFYVIPIFSMCFFYSLKKKLNGRLVKKSTKKIKTFN